MSLSYKMLAFVSQPIYSNCIWSTWVQTELNKKHLISCMIRNL